MDGPSEVLVIKSFTGPFVDALIWILFSLKIQKLAMIPKYSILFLLTVIPYQ